MLSRIFKGLSPELKQALDQVSSSVSLRRLLLSVTRFRAGIRPRFMSHSSRRLMEQAQSAPVWSAASTPAVANQGRYLAGWGPFPRDSCG